MEKKIIEFKRNRAQLTVLRARLLSSKMLVSKRVARMMLLTKLQYKAEA